MNSESELIFDKDRRNFIRLLTLSGVSLFANGCTRPNTPDTRSPAPIATVAPVPTMYDGQPLTPGMTVNRYDPNTYVSTSGFQVHFPIGWERVYFSVPPNVNEAAQLKDKGGKINLVGIYRSNSPYKKLSEMLAEYRSGFKETSAVFAEGNFKPTLVSAIKEELIKVDGIEAIMQIVKIEKPWLNRTSAITEPFHYSLTNFLENGRVWSLLVASSDDPDLAKKVNTSFHLVR